MFTHEMQEDVHNGESENTVTSPSSHNLDRGRRSGEKIRLLNFAVLIQKPCHGPVGCTAVNKAIKMFLFVW